MKATSNMCPVYDHFCDHCDHTQEEIYGMRETPEIRCEKCKCLTRRIITGGYSHSAPDQNWELENGGRGKWISGMGKRGDPKAYFRSRGAAVEAVRRANKDYELG
jgi:hypothetical protein